MVLLSGGIDSATCLYSAKRDGHSLRALTVRIHGTARRELEAARQIARAAGVKEHRLVSVPSMKEAADMKTDALRGLPRTYIPMKNLVYYGLAASYAEETGAGQIIGGHNKEDMQVFDDTSDAFFAQLQRALWSGSSRLEGNQTKIVRPLRKLTKAEVVARAASLGVPLRLTWSCHRDGSRHCWECEGCAKRAEAFREAGVRDPLIQKKV